LKGRAGYLRLGQIEKRHKGTFGAERAEEKIRQGMHLHTPLNSGGKRLSEKTEEEVLVKESSSPSHIKMSSTIATRFLRKTSIRTCSQKNTSRAEGKYSNTVGETIGPGAFGGRNGSEREDFTQGRHKAFATET